MKIESFYDLKLAKGNRGSKLAFFAGNIYIADLYGDYADALLILSEPLDGFELLCII